MLSKIAWAVLLVCGTSIAVEGPGVNSYWYKGYQVDVQTLDGVTIQAALMTVGRYNRVDVRVFNHSNVPVTIQPESIALTTTGIEDIDLPTLEEKEVQKSISNPLLGANLLMGFISTAAQKTSATTTTLPPDYVGAKAARIQPTRAEAEAARRHRIEQLLLQRITLLPSETTTGSLFFKGGGKFDGALVTIGLGTRLYNLPFGVDTPATAFVASNAPAPAGPAGASPPEGDASPAVLEIERGGNPLYYALGIEGEPNHAEGFLITAITSYSRAAKAGLRAIDDTIIAVNGVPVRTADEINRLIASGDSSKVTLTVMHQYWQEEKIIELH